jgi:hypothetical protein
MAWTRTSAHEWGRFGIPANSGAAGLPDHVRPAAGVADRVGAIHAEDTLRDERAAHERLLALHRGDAEQVIPRLHRSEKIRPTVAHHDRLGDADRVGRALRQPAGARRSAQGTTSVSASHVAINGVSTDASPWFSADALPPWEHETSRTRASSAARAATIAAVPSLEPSAHTMTVT